MAEEGFKPEYRAQLVQLLDETAQTHAAQARARLHGVAAPGEIPGNPPVDGDLRILAPGGAGLRRLHRSLRRGAKGADALKGSMPLLLARALRALAAQVKWMYVRYGPMDPVGVGRHRQGVRAGGKPQVRADPR